LLEPDNRIHNFIRKSGSAQNLGDQSIGIEGDWSDETVELVRSKRCILFTLACRGRRALRGRLCVGVEWNRGQDEKKVH
jgi:hypothetical protein